MRPPREAFRDVAAHHQPGEAFRDAATHRHAAGPLRCNLKRREGGVEGRTCSRDWLSVSAGSRRLRLLDTPLKGRVNCRAALGRSEPGQPGRRHPSPPKQPLDMSEQGQPQTSFMDFTLFSPEGLKGFNYFCSSLIRV